MLHSYEPSFDEEKCILCGTCIDRCPMKALTMGEGNLPDWNRDRCIGCAVCATGCQDEVITMVERKGTSPPPADQRALGEAIMRDRARAGR